MRILALLAIASLLTACGTSSFYSAPQGTMTEAQLNSTVLTSISKAAKTSFSAPAQLPSDLGVRRATRDLFDNCTSTFPAPLTDADADQIPLEKRVTWNCKDQTLAGHTGYLFSRTGTARMVDYDDASASGGYLFEYNNIVGGSTVGDNQSSYTYNGRWELAITGGTTWAYNSNFQGDYTGTETRVTAPVHTTWGSTWNHVITADDAADPGKSGALVMNGYYGYTVTDAATPANNASFVLKIESTDLKYKRDSCAGYYESGSYQFTDASANVFKVVHNSCTSRTCTFNGATMATCY
jgi:hypothetical protein